MKAQCEIKKDTLSYLSSQDLNMVVEYVFKNNTTDTIYLWIDYYNYNWTDNNISFEEKQKCSFFHYLRHHPCEFGIDFLSYDVNIQKRDIFFPIIGCNFLTKVFPKDTFTVITTDNGLLQENIHYLKQSVVSEFIPLQNIDEWLYLKKYIFVQKNN